MRLLHAVFVLWAATVGASVPFGTVLSIALNSKAQHSEQKYHAFYVTSLTVFMGGVQLIPLSIKAERSSTRPKHAWHLAGGLCSLPAFFTISASSSLGVQAVIVVQLACLLTTFFVIDVLDGRVYLSDHTKTSSLLIMFCGVALENLDNGNGGSMASGLQSVTTLVLVAISGMGFALQSKCNNALADDVGSPARASLVSACVNTLVSIPISLYIFIGCGVSASLDTSCWYLWLAAGFQNAFYISSMAYLPKVLGFTGCYAIGLGAKLVTSMIIDAMGLTGAVVPVSVTRLHAVAIVFAGALAFTMCGKRKDEPSAGIIELGMKGDIQTNREH